MIQRGQNEERGFCFALSADTEVEALAEGVRNYLDGLGFACSELKKQEFRD